MKRLFAGLALAFGAALAHAATLVPVQLLNPTGSTAGQALVSAGPSAVPAWASVAQSVAGRTGAVTLSVGDVSGAAPLASPTFTGTVTIPTGASITKPTIVGTTAADNAVAGSVGEYIASSTFSSLALTNNTLTNATSITLTAGDWDVYGHVMFTAANTTALTYVLSAINTASATLPAAGLYCQQTATWPTNGAVTDCPAPVTRISVSSATTVYLVVESGFSTSTLSVSGYLRARRVR